MDKWTFRHLVTRDLMALAVGVEALSLYPHTPWIVACAIPLTLSTTVHLLSVVAERK